MGQNEPSLGFLTALEDEQGGFLGGYLITNHLGRPLEFQCTTSVRPNRPQRILYGSSLRPYVMGELIGLTLVEKTATKADLLFTDQESVLALRHHLETPLVQVHQPDPRAEPAEYIPEASDSTFDRVETGSTDTCAMPSLVCQAGFEGDRLQVESWYRTLHPPLDLTEPFCRIHEAVAEALQTNSLR